ncbi:MAG: Rv3235 family protein [Arachnia sp.]
MSHIAIASRTRTPRAYGLVVAALEAIIGHRPLHQVRRHCAEEAFVSIARLRESGQFHGARVGRIRLQSPTQSCVEAATRIALGDRWVACAVRLDAAEDWRCSAFSVVEPGLILDTQ